MARAVDQHVEPPPGGDHPVHGRLDDTRVGVVPADGEASEFLGQGVCSFASGQHRHPVPARRQGTRRGGTDSAAAGDDEGHGPGFGHGVLLLRVGGRDTD
ncbi:hypothetical protein GCM10020256_69880 [Streptomyces thermocoprophilus]